MSIFEDATHYLRSANALLPKGWKVTSITLNEDDDPGIAQASGACFQPYKCGGRAGSLSNNVIPKTRMTFSIPWPTPAAPKVVLEDVTQLTPIDTATPSDIK